MKLHVRKRFLTKWVWEAERLPAGSHYDQRAQLGGDR